VVLRSRYTKRRRRPSLNVRIEGEQVADVPHARDKRGALDVSPSLIPIGLWIDSSISIC
jgi:hypothetical protein